MPEPEAIQKAKEVLKQLATPHMSDEEKKVAIEIALNEARKIDPNVSKRDVAALLGGMIRRAQFKVPPPSAEGTPQGREVTQASDEPNNLDITMKTDDLQDEGEGYQTSGVQLQQGTPQPSPSPPPGSIYTGVGGYDEPIKVIEAHPYRIRATVYLEPTVFLLYQYVLSHPRFREVLGQREMSLGEFLSQAVVGYFASKGIFVDVLRKTPEIPIDEKLLEALVEKKLKERMRS